MNKMYLKTVAVKWCDTGQLPHDHLQQLKKKKGCENLIKSDE